MIDQDSSFLAIGVRCGVNLIYSAFVLVSLSDASPRKAAASIERSGGFDSLIGGG